MTNPCTLYRAESSKTRRNQDGQEVKSDMGPEQHDWETLSKPTRDCWRTWSSRRAYPCTRAPTVVSTWVRVLSVI